MYKQDVLQYISKLLLSYIKLEDDLNGVKNIVNFSQRPDLGEFQSNIAFQLAKKMILGNNPRDVAEEIAKLLADCTEFKEVAAVAGFVNFSLSDKFLQDYANSCLNDKYLNIVEDKPKEKIVIDFGGPNIAKAMHVGHLRSSIIGDSLQKIYRYLGYEIISDIHLGDWGLPIGMIIMRLEESYTALKATELSAEDLQFISITLLEELYPLAAEQCKNDIKARQIAQKITMEFQVACTNKTHATKEGLKYYKIWQKIRDVSMASLKQNYHKMGIDFDLWQGESDASLFVDNLLGYLTQNNLSHQSEGAVIVDTSFKAPIILQTAEGSLTYATTDLATIYDRAKNLHADKIIYVVDKRQALHFKQIFELTSKTSWSDVKLEHVEFGTLNGKDGKPFKTREGGVMRLEDLFELTKSKVLEKMRDKESISAPEEIASIIGLAAIKFADLSKYRLTDYVFDIDQFTEFHGKTGPYLIYSCVRLKSILSKAQERNYTLGSAINLVHIREVRDLLLNMTKFYHFLQKAKAENSPHYLCDYIYNLAQSFSSLYSAVEILAEKDQNVRGSLLALCQLVLCNMEETLLLLGIDATKIEAM